MDRLNYSEIIKQVLTDYVAFFAQGGVSTLRTLFSDAQQNYMVLNIGWRDDLYIYQAIIHLEIIDGKIWIHNDDTEEGIATALLEAGVCKEHLVLGFRHPKIRQYTGFAVS